MVVVDVVVVVVVVVVADVSVPVVVASIASSASERVGQKRVMIIGGARARIDRRLECSFEREEEELPNSAFVLDRVGTWKAAVWCTRNPNRENTRTDDSRISRNICSKEKVQTALLGPGLVGTR